ncbi:MAG: hypothetical protein HY094_01490 [Candidatus Melainabacteria bacterium]|nr:hypothetical protein [Candidatus Melainabacteria bacterium]
MPISPTVDSLLMTSKKLSTKAPILEKDTIPHAKLEINLANNTPISGVPSLIDSSIRGIGRYFETLIDNYFIRIPFRFITETFRYGSSRSIQNILENKKADKELWITGVKKSLEITIGAAIIDPNRQSGYLARAGTGFLNMATRLGARAGMTALKILNKKQLNFKTLVDEFLSRTFCRIVYLASENPVIGIGCRTIEQFLINEWVRHLPFANKILPGLSKEQANNH